MMEVKVTVDGIELELNPFVTKMIAKVVEAMVTSLKGVEEDWKKIEIEVMR
jgi:hypothetical protein